MKSILAERFGKGDAVLNMSDAAIPSPGHGQVVVRVQACSLHAGDMRIMSGSVDRVIRPRFPYTPGTDVCGIVHDVHPDAAAKFKKGDCVISTLNAVTGGGGLAEYAACDISLSERKPEDVGMLEAAALPSSGVTAMVAVQSARIKAGDRVLVLGGSSGVGIALVQLARHTGATFIAATSTQQTLLTSLGVDVVVDYNARAWWDAPEFHAAPFDVLFDCIGATQTWQRARRVLKSGRHGGRFVAVAIRDPIQLHTWWQLAALAVPVLWAQAWTALWWCVPRYWAVIAMPSKGQLARLLEFVQGGHLRVVMEPASPFAFSLEGVRDAFRLLESQHAHGKIVVQM